MRLERERMSEIGTVQEIEDAVRQLSSEDLAAFRIWFAEFDAELWDRQLREDAESGRLDFLADAVYDGGRRR
jgi:hypothetical protein